MQQSAAAICQNGPHGLDQLLRVMDLLDLVVDTFEYPYGSPGTYHPPMAMVEERKGALWMDRGGDDRGVLQCVNMCVVRCIVQAKLVMRI